VLEEKLYELFREARAKNQPVTRSWFKTYSRSLFQQHYATVLHPLFSFSAGWFQNYLNRYCLSRRRITKHATKTPEDVFTAVLRFVLFIRKVSKPRDEESSGQAGTWNPYISGLLPSSPTFRPMKARRFPLNRVLNMDETPIPFEYLDGYSYEVIGAKTVAAKSDRSGWNKRQATLILYVFADGSFPLKVINRFQAYLLFELTLFRQN
jgi:hypothetical protein